MIVEAALFGALAYARTLVDTYGRTLAKYRWNETWWMFFARGTARDLTFL